MSTDESSQPLFGAAAAALIATVSAVALDRLRRRRKEEAALRQEMAARNAAAEAREQAQRTALAAAAKRLRSVRQAVEARVTLAGAALVAAAAAKVVQESRARRKLLSRGEAPLTPSTVSAADAASNASSLMRGSHDVQSTYLIGSGTGGPTPEAEPVANSEEPGGDGEFPTPTPTPPYPTPTPTESPMNTAPPPTETPQPTPSATMSPSETPTPSSTPTEIPIYPTDPPGTVIFDPEEFPEDVGRAAEDFVDSFSLLPDEPNPIHPYDWLSPFEHFPPTAPFVPYVRGALTFIATFIDLIRPLSGLDPTYPLPEPVPHGQETSQEDHNDV